MRRSIAIGTRLEQCDVGLRFPPRPEDHRVLHPHDRRVPYPPRQQPGEGIDARRMLRPDRRHLDDLPVEQFDAVVLVQDAQLGHAVVVVHREGTLEQSFRHRRSPPRSISNGSGVVARRGQNTAEHRGRGRIGHHRNLAACSRVALSSGQRHYHHAPPRGTAMTRSSLLRAGFALILCVVPAPRFRLPAPSVIEYPLPRPKAFPHDPAVGADGIVWYTDQANSYIGRLDPTTGRVTDYATPTPASGPHGIVVAPDGGVWYTGNFTGRLGRLEPATGVIKEYPLPSEARDPHTPLFHQGKVWFTVQGANQYGVLDPATGAAKIYPVPTPRARPYGLVAAPDGRIWYDESGTDQIVAFDPATERAETVKIPTPGSVVRNMAVDSSRARLWLALSGTQRLGRIDLK